MLESLLMLLSVNNKSEVGRFALQKSRICLKMQNFPIALLRWNEWESEGK